MNRYIKYTYYGWLGLSLAMGLAGQAAFLENQSPRSYYLKTGELPSTLKVTITGPGADESRNETLQGHDVLRIPPGTRARLRDADEHGCPFYTFPIKVSLTADGTADHRLICKPGAELAKWAVPEDTGHAPRLRGGDTAVYPEEAVASAAPQVPPAPSPRTRGTSASELSPEASPRSAASN